MTNFKLYTFYPNVCGSIKFMQEQLPRIKKTGVTHVLVLPFYPSPRRDHGYDITDHCVMASRFGTMEQFDEFVKTAHELGLKVLLELVLNHTSIEHPWLMRYPEFYHASKLNKPEYLNVFNAQSAWKYCYPAEAYCLHMFDCSEADLRWFKDGRLNYKLVEKFQNIVKVWTKDHYVDGFHLDALQFLNKTGTEQELDIDHLIFGDEAMRVINEIFPLGSRSEMPFLMAEIFDPTWGRLMQKYMRSTPIKACGNLLMKDYSEMENPPSRDEEDMDLLMDWTCQRMRNWALARV